MQCSRRTYLALDVGTDELAVGILHLPLDCPIPGGDGRGLHLDKMMCTQLLFAPTTGSTAVTACVSVRRKPGDNMESMCRIILLAPVGLRA